MAKVKQVENIVKVILEENEQARNDDFVLITEVYNRLVPNVMNLTFNITMLGHKELRLPAFESITRARRKLQEKHEYLRATEKVQELRKEEELEYISYAKDLN